MEKDIYLKRTIDDEFFCVDEKGYFLSSKLYPKLNLCLDNIIEQYGKENIAFINLLEE